MASTASGSQSHFMVKIIILSFHPDIAFLPASVDISSFIIGSKDGFMVFPVMMSLINLSSWLYKVRVYSINNIHCT
jgi:hypothetical protein